MFLSPARVQVLLILVFHSVEALESIVSATVSSRRPTTRCGGTCTYFPFWDWRSGSNYLRHALCQGKERLRQIHILLQR